METAGQELQIASLLFFIFVIETVDIVENGKKIDHVEFHMNSILIDT